MRAIPKDLVWMKGRNLGKCSLLEEGCWEARKGCDRMMECGWDVGRDFD